MQNPNEPRKPDNPNPSSVEIKADVLKAEPHPPLPADVVAKALERHNREHPGSKAYEPKDKKRR